MTIETEILNHLNSNWSQTPTIAWVNSNVTFNYDANTEYLIPSVVLAGSDVKEVPSNDGIVRRDFILGLNLLIKDNTGMANANTYTNALSAIFHKIDISTTNFTYHFDALEVSQGFGSGAHFEVPVVIDFYVFSS